MTRDFLRQELINFYIEKGYKASELDLIVPIAMSSYDMIFPKLKEQLPDEPNIDFQNEYWNNDKDSHNQPIHSAMINGYSECLSQVKELLTIKE